MNCWSSKEHPELIGEDRRAFGEWNKVKAPPQHLANR